MVTVIGALVFIGMNIAGMAIGKTLHEATHAIVAVALGGTIVNFSIIESGVTYELPKSANPTHVRAVGMAPFLTGMAIAGGYLLVKGYPPLTKIGIAGMIGWVWYTLRGGRSDYYHSEAIISSSAS